MTRPKNVIEVKQRNAIALQEAYEKGFRDGVASAHKSESLNDILIRLERGERK